MKRTSWCIFLACCLATSSFGQGTEQKAKEKIDSLQNLLQKASSDQAKSELLVALSRAYQYVDYEKSRTFADQALQVALGTQHHPSTYEAYKQLSLLASLSGDYNSALKFDNANLVHVVERKDSAGMAEVLNLIGNDYQDLGRYDEAYYYFTQSHRMATEIGDSLLMDISIHNVGTVFKDLGQYDIALQHFDVARKIGERIKDDDGLAYMLDEKGEVYLKKKDYEQARQYLNRALEVIRQRELSILEHRTLSKYATLSAELGNHDAAIKYYDSAYAIHKRNSNEFGLAEVDLGKSKVYLASGRFKEAESLLLSASETAHALHATKLETESFKLLSELAEAKGDFKSALKYFKAHKVLEDSIVSQEMVQRLYQSQLKFATETKDSEIASLTRTTAEQDVILKRQELLFNILVVVAALTAVLLISIYRSGQRRIRINRLLMEHQAEIKKRSVELEQLNQVKDKFFSIISHDLRSPMNALTGILDLAEKKHLTPEEFNVLTKELRVQFNHTKTLINNLLDWTLLQMDKLKIHEDRIDLQRLVADNFKLFEAQQPKNMQLKNEIPNGLFALADLNMVNLVFRNLIYNAIKFTEAGGLVTVRAEAKNGMVEVSIADNGVGIAPDVQKILFEKTSGYSTRGTANEKGTGLGLILCKEFVERNGGTIWLQSEVGKGSTFYFTLKKA